MPMASMIFVSSCPARPTNGSPWMSSSAPGASPTNIRSAFGIADAEHHLLAPERVQLAAGAVGPMSSRIAASASAGDANSVTGSGLHGRFRRFSGLARSDGSPGFVPGLHGAFAIAARGGRRRRRAPRRTRDEPCRSSFIGSRVTDAGADAARFEAAARRGRGWRRRRASLLWSGTPVRRRRPTIVTAFVSTSNPRPAR